ncbi:MAG: anaerobic sulfatase maturase [Clostridia bacterium]|nr:anaerobic sulfatase maturase [Clostridia bacterium]
MGKTKVPFAVMAKPVGSLCNLNCSYCYYLHNEQGGTIEIMPDDVLVHYIRSYIDSCPGKVYSFTWHGGEPTLASLAFFRRVVAIQKSFLPPGHEVWNNLQTNGQALTEEWCRFLAQEHFDVGLSIDGAQWIHDTYRKNLAGEGSWQKARDAVSRLQKYGIQPDLLCTVTSTTAQHAEETYRALRDMKTGWMQFIPIVRYNPDGSLTEDSVTPALYGEFLTRVFREWLYRDMGRTQVQFFSEILQILLGRSASLCTMLPVCGRVLVVEKDGGVYSCDHFVNETHKLGNVMAHSLGELIDSAPQKAFGESKRSKLTHSCRSCPYLRFCQGGCLKDRTGLSPDGESGHYLLCEGLKTFFDSAIPPLTYMVQRSRMGIPPERIMQELLLREKQK